MRYYLRNPPNRAITGPFELDDIEAKLEAGELPADTLATGDIGESLGQVRRMPAEEWMPVKSIPGFGQERPRNLPSREASPRSPTLALPPPTELFPARNARKPESPPEQISFCPFCGLRADGPIVLGGTRCRQCGKLLYPASGAVERNQLTSSRAVSFLGFAAGVIGGLVVQFVSFIFVCWCVAAFFNRGGEPALVVFAILHCLACVSIAIPLTRKPAARPLAFGILLGVGLTAILTANCALNEALRP